MVYFFQVWRYKGVVVPLIEWNESFSVNNTELDEQNKQWINIHNELHERLMDSQQNDTRSMMSDALRAMLDYAKYHFPAEEGYMDKIGYTESAMHMRLHKDFDNKLYQYNRDMLDGEAVLSTTIMKELENWVMNHILVEDRKYCLFAAER